MCAIVGGTFTVAGILDSLLFSATEIFRKAELGKLGWIYKGETIIAATTVIHSASKLYKVVF